MTTSDPTEDHRSATDDVPLRPVRVRTENGHQVIELPDDIHLDGDTAYLERDIESGNLMIRLRPTPEQIRSEWQEIFANLDAAGFPDDFMEERPLNRISRFRNPFSDEPGS